MSHLMTKTKPLPEQPQLEWLVALSIRGKKYQIATDLGTAAQNPTAAIRGFTTDSRRVNRDNLMKH